MFLKSLLLGGLSYSALLLRSPGEGGTDDNVTQQGDPQGNNASQGAEGDGGAEDTAASNDGGAEGSEGDPPAAAAGSEGSDEAEQQQQPDWRTRELNRKHRQLQDSRRRIQELEQETADLRALTERTNNGGQQQNNQQQQQERPAQQPARREVSDADVETRAQQLAATRRFNDDCNATAEKGKKEYGARWDSAAANLAQLGGFDTDTMVGILATDDPAKVLYELGSNPDEYHRLIDLPPARRVVEFAKIATKPKKPAPQRSRAAPPVDPVRARSSTDPLELKDEQEDEEWFKRRREQKRKHWDAQQARR